MSTGGRRCCSAEAGRRAGVLLEAPLSPLLPDATRLALAMSACSRAAVDTWCWRRAAAWVPRPVRPPASCIELLCGAAAAVAGAAAGGLPAAALPSSAIKKGLADRGAGLCKVGMEPARVISPPGGNLARHRPAGPPRCAPPPGGRPERGSTALLSAWRCSWPQRRARAGPWTAARPHGGFDRASRPLNCSETDCQAHVGVQGAWGADGGLQLRMRPPASIGVPPRGHSQCEHRCTIRISHRTNF